MSNELKDIANKLSGYSDGEGWDIYSAEKLNDGSWRLEIRPESKEPKAIQEATNDNN